MATQPIINIQDQGGNIAATVTGSATANTRTAVTMSTTGQVFAEGADINVNVGTAGTIAAAGTLVMVFALEPEQ